MKCPSIAGGIETIQYSSSVSYTGVDSRLLLEYYSNAITLLTVVDIVVLLKTVAIGLFIGEYMSVIDLI